MKVLVIRFSSIGDIVLTSPVLRCLRLQTGAEVHVLTKSAYATVLEPNPYVAKVWALNDHLDEVLQALEKEQFDHIVDLHNNLRSFWVKWVLRRPSTTFNKLNVQKWLLVRFGIHRMPNVHIVDRYMRAVQDLGVWYDGAGLDYFIPNQARVQPHEFDAHLQSGAYIAFAIGATHATKRLPLEKIVETCRLSPMPVVLLGGKAEAMVGAAVAQALPDRVVDLCGKLSLHQSASFLQQAHSVITHDTGLMHMAAALRRPIVSVWGNTVPEFGMTPFYPDSTLPAAIVQVKDLKCRPCSKLGYEKCPKGHFKCMNSIDPKEIISHILPLK